MASLVCPCHQESEDSVEALFKDMMCAAECLNRSSGMSQGQNYLKKVPVGVVWDNY